MGIEITDDIGRDYHIPHSVRLIAFMDLDGTLTDGTVLYDGKNVSRQFNVQDGYTIEVAKKHGIISVIVTSSPLTADIKQRAVWLDTPIFSSQHHINPAKTLISEVATLRYNFLCAHIGDDLGDLELLSAVEYPFIPSNANPKLGINLDKRDVVYTKLESHGGHGAVRDYLYTLIDIISQDRA